MLSRTTALMHLKNAHAKQNAADNQTVEEATAGMTADQKDAWLQEQSLRTQKDMQSKGIPVDGSRIGQVRFCDEESEAGVGPDDKDININRTVAKRLTVRELRAELAHEIEHTQQPKQPPYLRSDSIDVSIDKLNRFYEASEKDADKAAGRTYGAKTYSKALDKSYEGASIARNEHSTYDHHGTLAQRKEYAAEGEHEGKEYQHQRKHQNAAASSPIPKLMGSAP
jgi:hypothetical protein